MTKDEALQKALDALGPTPPDCCGCQAEWQIAITAIKEALAQPEMRKATREEKISNPGVYEVPAQPAQEPVKVAHRHEWFRTNEMKVGEMRCISCGVWGHEGKPQRTWVGLTDDDIDEIYNRQEWDNDVNYDYEYAIEAKLKEKNT